VALDDRSEPEPDVALNLVDRVLEVYRDPIADAAAPFGWHYATTERLGAQSHVAPLAAPAVRRLVSDFLP